jgi:hypothetical protein
VFVKEKKDISLFLVVVFGGRKQGIGKTGVRKGRTPGLSSIVWDGNGIV